MKHTNTLTNLLLVPALVGLLAGCSSTQQRRATHTRTTTAPSTTAPARSTAAAPAAAAPSTGVRTVDTGGFDMNAGVVRLTKRAPAQATVGDTFMNTITVTANQDAANVVVTDQVPSGASYVRSEPSAEVAGSSLNWRFPNMKRGETKTIQVYHKADREGELTSCSTVSAQPVQCVTIMVGRPALAITKTGPETAALGSSVTYNITVRNTGNSTAKDVVVTDATPEGMSHTSGQASQTFNVGDLGPGQSRSIPVTFRADRRGRVCNTAVAASSNAGRVDAQACTLVVQPGVEITKTGDAEQVVGRQAGYTITVRNTGDVPLTGVVVTDTAPPQTTIASAQGASVAGNTATWNVGNLNANESRDFRISLTGRQAGRYCNSAGVRTAQGLAKSAEACTVWRGIAAILVEVVDDPDPLAVGESTTYTIRITNQGFADLHNIGTVADFDDENTPSSSPQGQVSGQRVTFPKVASLAPKQSVTYTISVKGVKAGDARNRFTVTCDEKERPVVEEESTTTY